MKRSIASVILLMLLPALAAIAGSGGRIYQVPHNEDRPSQGIYTPFRLPTDPPGVIRTSSVPGMPLVRSGAGWIPLFAELMKGRETKYSVNSRNQLITWDPGSSAYRMATPGDPLNAFERTSVRRAGVIIGPFPAPPDIKLPSIHNDTPPPRSTITNCSPGPNDVPHSRDKAARGVYTSFRLPCDLPGVIRTSSSPDMPMVADGAGWIPLFSKLARNLYDPAVLGGFKLGRVLSVNGMNQLLIRDADSTTLRFATPEDVLSQDEWDAIHEAGVKFATAR